MTQYSGKIIRKNPVVPTQVSASGVWTLDDAANATKANTWPVAGVPNPISRSLRFRQSASAYLSRTPGAASNRTTWTWSGWVKRGALTTSANGGVVGIFGGGTLGTSQSNFVCYFNSNYDIYLQETVNNVSNQLIYETTSLYRDPSAWYHIVIAMDTTQATAANRTKIYVNGVQAPGAFSVTPAQNQALSINNNVPQYIGGASVNPQAYGNVLGYVDGYITEVNFIDGQQLTPSSFGTTDAATGAWIPMPYTGTYGTNGYYLNFKDNTSTTTLGYDYSGNSNHWTTNNISLTAGATYDSMVDVPTLWMAYNTAGDVGATVRGNYCTMNPLSGDYGTFTLSSANLNFAGARTATATAFARSTIGVSSGKWYWEVTPTDVGGGPNIIVGIQDVATTATTGTFNTLPNGYGYNGDGTKDSTGSQVAYGATYAANDVIGIALDMDAGTIVFYKNNTSQGTAFTGITGTYCPVIAMNTAGAARTIAGSINFGQRPFTYTPPTGFKTLNTFNLPDATIKKGNAFFDATIYTGDGTSSKAIVNSGSMQPDMVWLKVRNTTDNHSIADSVRGAPALIQPNTTAVENAAPLQGSVGSFNSNGFTIAAGATNNTNYNTNGNTYVAWQWNAGGATVSNNSGSIASQVRANPAAGVSVVTYTGTGANATVGHGLGVAPRMYLVKSRSLAGENWIVYHTSLGNAQQLNLNTTAAQAASTNFNSTSPTSSVFSIGSGTAVNSNTNTYVAYCFAAVAGYSAFGSYTGNGSADGPFVHCGFKPKFVMVKRADAVENWRIFDTGRDSSLQPLGNELYPNLTNAEASVTAMDFLSNGFKQRQSVAGLNASGGTYIFMAFAEYPFKNSNAR